VDEEGANMTTNDKKVQWLERRTWQQFQEAGMVWFVNRLLHVFGWAIVFDVDKDDHSKIHDVYPARSRFRGFEADCEEEGFKRVTAYLRENLDDLAADCELGDENHNPKPEEQ
jgi:hypothetical protein